MGDTDQVAGKPGRVVTFCNPSSTVPVSLTGTECDLNCAHCGGKYLRHMRSPVRALEELEAGRASSVLVSGGCDSKGRLPLKKSLELLANFKDKGRVNLHPGLVTEDEARALSGYVDAVSLDMVGDDETIAEVYGNGLKAQDYRRTFKALKKHVRVVPHLCLGLRGGRLGHEVKVVDFLSSEGTDTLVFLVFIPTPGTGYEGRKPPPHGVVADFVALARERLPGVSLTLGCMRPGGRYRQALDPLCIERGIDMIVNPSPAAREYVAAREMKVAVKEGCCCLAD